MNNKPTILLVANWESGVGYAWWLMESFWTTIADQTNNKGFTNLLIYPKITSIPQTIHQSDILIEEFNFNAPMSVWLPLAYRLCKQHNVQYIYLTDWPTFNFKYIFLKLFGVKKILIHEHTPGERTPAHGFKRILKVLTQRIPFFTADYFIAVTDFIFDRFINVACIPRQKCFVAPNGIIPIDLDKADLKYCQKTFNIPEDRTVIITTGRATYYKGIDFFIKCANRLVNEKQRKDFHFLYCGDGPNLDEFKQLVSGFKLDNFFTFAGKRNDVREILPSCHIGFHAALGEVGYSLSILEYMNSRLVTIVPNNASTALATTHGETGYLYDRSSLDSAVDCILKAAEHSEDNESIRDQGKRMVDQTLTLSHTHSALQNIVNNTILRNTSR